MVEIPVEPDLDIESLLPLKAMVITLESVGESHPSFFHHPALTAYLRYLAGSPDDYSQLIRTDAPETGRPGYLPGDYYRFMLIGLNGSDAILDNLLHQLSQLPVSAPKTGRHVPFSNNWRLISVQDAFREAQVKRLTQLSDYTTEQLNQEVELWHRTQRLHWRWLSPARLLKEKDQRKGCKNEARFCRDSLDVNGQLLLNRVHDSFAGLLRERGLQTGARGIPPELEIENSHLFWIDAEYTDAKGKTAQLGGMTGILDLDLEMPLNRTWWRLLILGQYTGIGQNTAFGAGRYQLVMPDGALSYRRPLPANSLLSSARQSENLVKAWWHVMSNMDLPDAEEVEWMDESVPDMDEEPPEAPLERLQKDIDRMLAGDYKAPYLYGKLVPKQQGGIRPLTIPPVYDRVLQRAIHQILSPALEQLMYRHSHGFRTGHSRMSARYDVQAAWRAGYRWVYESDIKDFFDSVDWQRLRGRLNAIYGQDPVVRAIMAWMSAPVRFQGHLIQRQKGLPQGSPLSPLMANLMLDDFDNDMEQAGFHMIRFADDFIVLCRDPEQAKAAGEAAKRSLQEHGLDLHDGKTRITAMQDGFKYLGYLFVNDMALDVSGANETKAKQPLEPPANSWLAQLGEREPTRLKRQNEILRVMERLSRGTKAAIGEREDDGTLLAVTGEPARITTLNKQLHVLRKDKRLYQLPWSSLQAILVFGNHQITTQAMHAALRQDVAIHLCTTYGRYQGVIGNNRSMQGHRLWLTQLATFDDSDKALYCSREVVLARLIHMKENLRQRGQAHHLTQIENAIRHAGKAKSVDSLRGLEGSATREYYERIALLLPDDIGFSGRNRRPPRDPFNVLLSLGYTVLYGYSESVLHSIGLLPRQGFYHQARGTHAALASDLMEPFRHIVERTALSLILRHEIKPEDFEHSAAGACIIADEARRKYLALLLSRWENAIRGRGEIKPEKYFNHLYTQARSLKAFIQIGEPFKAWRLH